MTTFKRLAFALLLAVLGLQAQTIDNNRMGEVTPYPIRDTFPGVCHFGNHITYTGSGALVDYICNLDNKTWSIVGPGSGGGTGPAGPTGPQGPAGPTGPTGATGATGAGSATNGSSGQGLTSNGAGAFGTPVTLAPSATTDTTNAGNISSGTLPHARLPALVSGDIVNNAANTSGTAAVATALASTTNCSAGSYTLGISVLGVSQGCTVLAPSATTDTTNAANISSGTLNHARLPVLLSGDIPNNAANTSGTAGNLSGTPALPNGTSGSTQSPGDNTTDLATDHFVNLAVSAATTITPSAQNANYTVLSSDAAHVLTTNATATYTLPQAGSTGFPSGTTIQVSNNGNSAAVLTVTTTTSVFYGGTATGSSIQVFGGTSATFRSDGTNWFTIIGGTGVTDANTQISFKPLARDQGPRPYTVTTPGSAYYALPAGTGTACSSGVPCLLSQCQANMAASGSIKTCVLGDGTYTLTGDFTTVNGTDDNETYMAAVNAHPVIDGGSAHGIIIQSASHLSFIGITFDHLVPTAWGFDIFINGNGGFASHDVTFSHCIFDHFINTGILGRADNFIFDSNVIRNQSPGSVGNNPMVGVNYYPAVSMSGNNVQITHNDFHDIEGVGIAVGDSAAAWGNTLVDRNVFRHVNFNSFDSGPIYVGDAIPSLMTATALLITNNYIDNFGGVNGLANWSRGIYLDFGVHGATVMGNVCRGLGETCIQIHGGDHNAVTGNIFDLSAGAKVMFYQSSMTPTGMAANTLAGNLVQATAAFPAALYEVGITGGDVLPADSANMYSSGTSAPAPTSLAASGIGDTAPVIGVPGLREEDITPLYLLAAPQAHKTGTIATGTAALGTSAIASAACATVVTVPAANADPTTPNGDTLSADFASDPTGVVGYQASASGMLSIVKYITAGNVNFKVCNNTGGSITPGAITLNWRVTR